MLDESLNPPARDKSPRSCSVWRRLTWRRFLVLSFLLLLVWKVVWLVRMDSRRQALARLEECRCRAMATHPASGSAVSAQENLLHTVEASGGSKLLRYLFPIDGLDCGTAPCTGMLGHLKHFPELEILAFGNASGLTDAHLEHLPHLRDLHTLYLTHTSLTDEGVARLGHLQSLRVLYLGGPDITGQTLEHLGCQETLEELSVEGCYNMTDAGMLQIGRFKNLRRLVLTTGDPDPRIFQGHGFAVLEQLPKLEHVTLWEFNRHQWAPFVKQIPNVETR